MRRIVLGLPLLLLLACYEPNPIETACVSPDGRYLALTTAKGELGVVDLTTLGAMKIYSRYVGRGMAWSPDSRRLAFIEQFPNTPSALWLLDLGQGRAKQPLLINPAWKADPVWLSQETIAFLSDLKGERVSIWAVETRTGAARELIGRETNISRLWGSPRGGVLIFQSIQAGSPELWSWRPKGGPPVQLTHDQPNETSEERNLAFSADGQKIAYLTERAGLLELVCFDLASSHTLDRLPMKRPVDNLAILKSGRVVAGLGDRLRIWRPQAPWYRRAVTESGWHGVPLRLLAAWKGEGVAVAANQSMLLVADKSTALESGRLNARQLEDVIFLAYAEAKAGHIRNARKLLMDAQSQARKGSRQDFLIDTALGQLERMERDWRQADRWLARGIEAAPVSGPQNEALWLERLALAYFGAQDSALARWILEKMPGPVAQMPLPVWIAAQTQVKAGNRQLERQWMAIGGAVRQGQAPAAARLIHEALAGDAVSTPTLKGSFQGLSLLLNGDFEPLGAVSDLGQNHVDHLMGQPAFQLTLLKVSQMKNPPDGPPAADLEGMLLMQWVRQGDFSSARQLVREMLETRPDQALPNFLDMMRQYLVIEESDRWQQRAVTDVLLQQDIADTLDDRYTSSSQRLTMRLAQVKKALVDGELGQAQTRLAEARKLALHAQTGEVAESSPFEQAQTEFQLRLFQAKIHERKGDRTLAVNGYQTSLDLMREAPGNWEISPYEITVAIGLIQTAGAKDPDLLRSYLEVIRGMGDPLINPSRVTNTLEVALDNLQTLRRVAPDPWILPYLTYSQGMCYSLLDRPWQALDSLQRARQMNPPASLLQRILLEEAALHDSLGQHALAARLYRRISAMSLPISLRASAILAAIQAEQAGGVIQSPANRLREILKNDPMPPAWRDWLWIQMGGGGTQD